MPETRQDSFDRISADPAFDVVVIGGGINGIGVFRELALQGLRVLLVERNDYSSGCSAAPSRMIHGGLRYLENGEFSLVKESLRERDALLANAAHMVRPLPTTVPITSIFSGLLNGAASFLGLSTPPARRGALALKAGLSMYDWITRKRRRLPPHQFRSATETLRLWPRLTPKLRGSATFFDAWISYPERLAIELLLDTGREAPGSVALNYAELVRRDAGYAVQDHLTGQEYPVTARALVNATGAWLDESLADLADRGSSGERYVSGTKGSHIVLDHPELHAALNGHMIFFENGDGRVCVVFPYLGKVLAGSTDIRVEKAERVYCTDEERDYILDALRAVFPSIRLGAEQIIYSYSGIRPLPRSDHAFTGRISRGHMVRRIDGTVPQFCMIGGKWTTFRAFAEQTTDAVLDFLGKARVRDTYDLPIGGGAGFPEEPGALEQELVARHGISAARAAWLVDLYGTRADTVLAFCGTREDDVPLDAGLEVTAAEIAYLAQQEHVVHLADLVLRRLPLAITGLISSRRLEALAAVLAGELGWTVEERQEQIADLAHQLHTYHGVSADMLTQRN
ncbi:glycerol-3-phosphate dehydrogenase/oxidase [uncultured Devosia sp.]|mgnify:FL=1|uniref:glycerol-3-phosphate dehydrogenase/oxidase n=1 Tax=uncultured Devosia sp. TaxID=211434 RepID=UPI0026298272|nr:glycerol-3-phosphate dehydrogenase/oxidase [uncultured Devosia sp.]